MYDFEFIKSVKKPLKKKGKRLLIDFEDLTIDKPNRNEIIIEEEKLKEDIKKPKTKIEKPKKGKKLF